MPFGGTTYDPTFDRGRLLTQVERVRLFMLGASAWFTLREVSTARDIPEASISARLRDLRKKKFGGYEVDRRRRCRGLWEYRVLLPMPTRQGRLM